MSTTHFEFSDSPDSTIFGQTVLTNKCDAQPRFGVGSVGCPETERSFTKPRLTLRFAGSSGSNCTDFAACSGSFCNLDLKCQPASELKAFVCQRFRVSLRALCRSEFVSRIEGLPPPMEPGMSQSSTTATKVVDTDVEPLAQSDAGSAHPGNRG